jgi:thymidylate synthase ThyX
MIKSEIIADSLNSKGNRLTTFILEYPRFIHSELMTHRMFSKNAASSRAIPIEKMIRQVIEDPAIPEYWGKNQSGMKADEELDNTGKFHAEENWLLARDSAIEHVKTLSSLGLHKQIINRLLEPWFNIRIILSGTEFENFFALRAHPDAQPELQKLAYLMLEQYNNSKPSELKAGEWHIPFGSKIDETRLWTVVSSHGLEEAKRKIAVARCARVSYFNYEGKDDYEADIKLCDRLFGSNPKHLSPTEHVAQAQDDDKFIGNFKGFKQYRYFFPDQNLKDERVKKYDS